MGNRRWAVTTAGICALGPAMQAAAATIELGGGWEATWDDSLNGLVDIASHSVVGDALFIQKSAEFTQGPVSGVFPSIPIVFRQVSFPAATHIVIDDEIITNSTGEPWTGFLMQLLNEGDAVFDPVATAESNDDLPIGFTIAPFTEAAFSSDNTALTIGGGLLAAGGVWFPGDGGGDGQLWIDVTPHAAEPFTVFTLKETPLPEPGTLLLLTLGGLALTRRRR